MTAHTAPARPWTERPPLRRPLLALLVSVTVTGAAGLWAVWAAPESFRQPMAYGAGATALVLCLVLTMAVHQREKVRRYRRRTAYLADQSRKLAEEVVPDLLARLRGGASADSALAATPPLENESYQRVVEQLARAIGQSESRRAAALAASANAAGRMQALATSMLADLRDMEHRHSDEEVLADLLHLDHRTAQAGRLADSIAVLTGARSGRRWAKPIVMESILRGAMGRIAGYQRVRLHSTTGIAVAGHAAEGVMHGLAELLDNACNFSPPTAEVHVYVEEVPAGAIITVEDSGLVMSDVALRRAEKAVSPEAAADLAGLSGTRLGLAVVGRLARKHGLTVSFRPSARGGTGALMMIPQDLISRPQDREDPPARAATAGATGTGGFSATSATHATPAPAPSRRGRRTAAAGGEAPWTDGTDGEGAWPAESWPAAATGRGRGGAEPAATPDHAPAAPAAGPAPTRASADAGAGAGSGPDDPDTLGIPRYSPGGLPKRRRGQTLAAAHSAGQSGSPTPAPSPARTLSPAESAARFGAFRRAVQGQDRGQDGSGSRPAPDRSASSSPSHPEDDA
ncbi:sensor histidine kinase [Streptomyces aidingensis]|uniref:histidine kinase n=1 Tax=Streptomyces aidingensis TaxID=910347 RepID=A0A1I1HJU8_9ACTN|nr:ATP-binding protein [Streptomyces aidingensis]SFC21723.1 Signal transduction histidine kinase [Streptomyces aidingensis]